MSWLQVRNQKEEDTGPVELLIYDQIGEDWFSNSGVSAKEFAATLKTIPENRDIIVGINSPGGNVWDGLAIYHQLSARANRVTTRIDGVAASIASVIALAGKPLNMPKNALMMIHRASGLAIGNAEEMRKMASDLEAHDNVIAGIYASHTGRTKEEMLDLMDAETWMSGEDAKKEGFISDFTEEKMLAAHSFDLSRFRCVPGAINRSDVAAQPKDTMQSNTATASPNSNAQTTTVDVNAAILAALNKMNDRLDAIATPAPQASAPVQPTIVNVGSPLWNKYGEFKPGEERLAFTMENFNDLYAFKRGLNPQNANTISSSLYPNIAIDKGVDVLSSRLAPLSMFTTDFSLDAMRPMVPVVLWENTAGPTVQTNPTDFTAGNSTLAPITVTPARITATVQMTDVQFNRGFKLSQLAYQQSLNMSYAINDVVTALFLVGTFGTALTVGTAANFTADDLGQVLAAAKDYTVKNLWLDGGHLGYLLPTNRFSFAIGENGAYGFDSIVSNSRWTGATANTCGLVFDPRAIVCTSGLSAEAPVKQYESLGTLQLANGMGIRLWAWWDPNTQIMYSMMDIIFGAAVSDATAAELLITA